ncbi:DNA-binding response regulator [Clostridium perfringens]|nr:DNA-binding response regulator [Clostridium perfringens]
MRILEELNKSEKKMLEIMDYYNSGYTFKEIANMMFMSERAVKKRVQNWFSSLEEDKIYNLKYRHELERKRRKIPIQETIKAINYEATREMGDKAFVLKNRSIYKTRENGNIVLKTENELDCKVTWDTPKRLNNDSREEIREEFRPVISNDIGRVIASHYSKEMSNTRILSKEEQKIIYNSNYLN